MARLAFYTFAVQRGPDEDPVMRGFVLRTRSNFAAVEQSDGFIDRSGYDNEPDRSRWGAVVMPRFCDDPAPVAATLSLWRDLESAAAFAYGGVHAKALRRRREWFSKADHPGYVAWWVADDHRPDWAEAAAKLEALHDNGPQPEAFDFKQPFDAAGRPMRLAQSPHPELVEG